MKWATTKRLLTVSIPSILQSNEKVLEYPSQTANPSLSTALVQYVTSSEQLYFAVENKITPLFNDNNSSAEGFRISIANC